ncbi:hypothetical protein SK128_017273 [Halocaridina rubra]|uniref:Uncharacterized protein n=1 Tax=Halocaridina rubra TaxID=373956 RepID=A0AAN8XCH0_HALRR
MGRLIHAVDYLRWSENEGANIQGLLHNTTNAKKVDDDTYPDTRGRRRRQSDDSAGKEEETLRLLLIGADLKHILRTLHDTPEVCTQVRTFMRIICTISLQVNDVTIGLKRKDIGLQR